MFALPRSVLLFLLIMLLPQPLWAAQENPFLFPGFTTVRMVGVSRHGVRAPTQPRAELERWTARPWPVWPVPRGHLTPRGAALISAQWQALRPLLQTAGLLPCGSPSPEELFVHADRDQRTRATAQAILQALGPDLSFSTSTDRIDPLFSPVKAQKSHYAAAALHAAIPPAALQSLYHSSSEELGCLADLIGPASEAFCTAHGLAAPCTLREVPAELQVSRHGQSAHITGSLGMASDIAELFLLEWGEWPGQRPGWGAVTLPVLRTLLPLHTRTFSLLNRALPAARANGSLLLAAIRDRLLNDEAPPCNLYIGHDTNLANLGGLLDLNWNLRGYPENATPPGGLLAFLLLERPDHHREIRVVFLAASLETLHRPVTSTLPLMTEVPFPQCGTPCTPERFSALITDRMAP